ncbi:MAG: PQQ-dependent sugar dehydrogenase [Nannocystis sp.]|nr:PQQ-dependent sugar dehydrogenase [Nannocystis sp.]MBA3548512.1 PQQ-dependent sugar dehydrogenase [Nannocystis sp.]
MRASLLASFSVVLIAGASLAGCNRSSSGGTQGETVETRPPNAPEQNPAFPGQTRAPVMTTDTEFDVRTIASGLEHPWSLAFLPDGAMLVSERPGRLRVITDDGTLSPPVAGLAEVDARDQGGLLDVAIDPRFADNNLIYWSYAEPRDGGNGTAVARGRLVRGAQPRIEDLEVIWRMTPTLDSTMHFGGRMVFSGDDILFITTGERSILEGRRQAQQLDSAFGKVIRIRPDGSVPADNPLVGRNDALPEIWSWGHRNLQAAALHPETGQLWVVDHGPKGGDEINAIDKGKDYGWPTITYGEEYKGGPVGEGITAQEGMEQPLYYWDPSIAPSGMAFYDGDLFPAWKGSLFVGALVGEHLARLTLEGSRIIGEERLLAGQARIRDVKVGPDGALYLLTDEDDGELLALVPAGSGQ